MAAKLFDTNVDLGGAARVINSLPGAAAGDLHNLCSGLLRYHGEQNPSVAGNRRRIQHGSALPARRQECITGTNADISER